MCDVKEPSPVDEVLGPPSVWEVHGPSPVWEVQECIELAIYTAEESRW